MSKLPKPLGKHPLNPDPEPQEPTQAGETTASLLSQLQAREDKLEQLNQTLDAYFLTLMEANGLE